jgi:hypothetical protein
VSGDKEDVRSEEVVLGDKKDVRSEEVVKSEEGSEEEVG